MKHLAAPTLISALLLSSTPLEVHSARGVLHADGILNVRGGDEVGTRVTVMPRNAPSYVLVRGASKFMLDLELDNTYMVTFEKEGCVTKQLYFDTTVPVDQHANDFTFPFKVTLESHERSFVYAGPVGFIVYKHGLADFGYETDYTVKVDGMFATRMDAIVRTGSDPIAERTSPQVFAVATSGYQRPGEARVEPSVNYFADQLAPIVSQVPRLVHTTSVPARNEAPDAMPSMMVVPKELPVPPTMAVAEEVPPSAPLEVKIANEAPMPAITATMEPERPAEAHVQVRGGPMAGEAVVSEEPVPRASVPNTASVAEAPSVRTAAIDGAPMREEQLVVEGRRVITIVRFHHAGGREEVYRKVVHAYGATFYFKDGLSVPEHMYTSGTAL